MAKTRVDPDELTEFLTSGHSQADAARHFGVSEAAISLRVKQLGIAASKVVALELERGAVMVDHQLSARDRLARIQRSILDQLSWAEDQARQPGVDRPELIDLIVKLSGEVRNQLRLEHDISRTLIDLRVVRDFQRTVFEEISKESPDTARRIVDRLKERRALRQSVDLPPLDGHGGFDVD
jgi:hypothetical protein